VTLADAEPDGSAADVVHPQDAARADECCCPVNG
jgi:hypothetical protein